MPMNKPHLEFHEVDMNAGWATPPGYPPGIKQKILASDLDETRKMGGRTRLLALRSRHLHDGAVRARSLGGGLSRLGRSHRRQRRAGQRRRGVRGADLCLPPARRPSRAVQVRERLRALRDPLLRREQECFPDWVTLRRIHRLISLKFFQASAPGKHPGKP